ncbi:hypothetical protein K6745_23900 (plasmid) [Vibrio alginolyticus]|uniref:hypothetical protein n=1 Tax=Vibrio alginolyticus TaxID=663 RepID=UPI001EEEA660|nr:hypothetical protein [Vibrio alginolyticus]ULF72078.1 hypothetical protein K6745_23900 [Vibrio alginolyticus]
METEQLAEKQTYLVVPYEERNHAVKAAGKLPDGKMHLNLMMKTNFGTRNQEQTLIK